MVYFLCTLTFDYPYIHARSFCHCYQVCQLPGSFAPVATCTSSYLSETAVAHYGLTSSPKVAFDVKVQMKGHCLRLQNPNSWESGENRTHFRIPGTLRQYLNKGSLGLPLDLPLGLFLLPILLHQT